MRNGVSFLLMTPAARNDKQAVCVMIRKPGLMSRININTSY